MGVKVSLNIRDHRFIGVFIAPWGTPVVPEVEEMNMKTRGKTKRKGLPIIRRAEQAVEDNQWPPFSHRSAKQFHGYFIKACNAFASKGSFRTPTTEKSPSLIASMRSVSLTGSVFFAS